MRVDALIFDLPGLLADAAGMARAAASAKGLLLHLRLHQDLPRWVIGDPVRLRRALDTLLGNAVKFTEAGQIIVEADHRLVAGEQIELDVAVRDSGIGIAPEALARLFGRFEQAEPSTARLHGGSGLGLAMCRMLVVEMGGEITAESTRGQGSQFRFTIRLRPGAAPPEAVTAPAIPRPSGQILVAEDVRANQVLLREFLAPDGHVLQLVDDGLSAVSAAAAADFDLVVMDLNMPRMDGLEATRAIRALAGRRGRVPILAMTGDTTAEAHAACLEAGMWGVVTKPIGAEALRRAIADALAPAERRR